MNYDAVATSGVTAMLKSIFNIPGFWVFALNESIKLFQIVERPENWTDGAADPLKCRAYLQAGCDGIRQRGGHCECYSCIGAGLSVAEVYAYMYGVSDTETESDTGAEVSGSESSTDIVSSEEEWIQSHDSGNEESGGDTSEDNHFYDHLGVQ